MNGLDEIIHHLREIRREVRNMGDFDDERTEPEDIAELCARLRQLPRKQQPLAFESGAPDMFGPLWRFNALEALGEDVG